MTSGRKVLEPVKFIDAQSLGAAFTSSEVDVRYLDLVGITLACTGVTGNTGNFKLEVSSGGVWEELDLDPMLLADADQDFLLSLRDFPWAKLRMTFTASGGTPNGVVTGWINGKAT